MLEGYPGPPLDVAALEELLARIPALVEDLALLAGPDLNRVFVRPGAAAAWWSEPASGWRPPAPAAPWGAPREAAPGGAGALKPGAPAVGRRARSAGSTSWPSAWEPVGPSGS
jgi:hypothetical protein